MTALSSRYSMVDQRRLLTRSCTIATTNAAPLTLRALTAGAEDGSPDIKAVSSLDEANATRKVGPTLPQRYDPTRAEH